MIAIDFLLNEDGDLDIQGGDFVTGESETQHVDDILIAAPGTFKNEPLVGVDLLNELNAPNGGEDINRVRKLIATQMELDGIGIVEMDFTSLEDFELKVERE
jgi:hypothetical protein